MFDTIVGAGAASRYGFDSDQMMRLLSAPALAPQHWQRHNLECTFGALISIKPSMMCIYSVTPVYKQLKTGRSDPKFIFSVAPP
jgi:hypothetical protein